MLIKKLFLHDECSLGLYRHGGGTSAIFYAGEYPFRLGDCGSGPQ